MTLVLAPIPTENVEAWKAWNNQLTNEKKEEFDDFNHRHEIERHSAWFSETPAGPMVIVLHEGPGADHFMENIATSTNEFDVWFRESISKFHNLDFSKPPEGPMPEQVLNIRSNLAAH